MKNEIVKSLKKCADILNLFEFSLTCNIPDKTFSLVDLQDANIGNIELERFESLNKVIDRLSGSYTDHYLSQPIEEILDNEYDIEKDLHINDYPHCSQLDLCKAIMEYIPDYKEKFGSDVDELFFILSEHPELDDINSVTVLIYYSNIIEFGHINYTVENMSYDGVVLDDVEYKQIVESLQGSIVYLNESKYAYLNKELEENSQLSYIIPIQNDEVTICNRCHSMIYSTPVEDYAFFCKEENEDLFNIEVKKLKVSEYLKLLKCQDDSLSDLTEESLLEKLSEFKKLVIIDGNKENSKDHLEIKSFENYNPNVFEFLNTNNFKDNCIGTLYTKNQFFDWIFLNMTIVKNLQMEMNFEMKLFDTSFGITKDSYEENDTLHIQIRIWKNKIIVLIKNLEDEVLCISQHLEKSIDFNYFKDSLNSFDELSIYNFDYFTILNVTKPLM